MKRDDAARVRRLLARRGVVVERCMMGGVAFLVDGAMCCSVGPRGLLVRVEAASRAGLLARAHVRPMKLGARTMRGFVRVEPAGYRTDRALATWLDVGLAAAHSKKSKR